MGKRISQLVERCLDSGAEMKGSVRRQPAVMQLTGI
jgi:hypothetical protein